MQARYVRETVANRHCLILIVDGVRHLIATSRVIDSATFGASTLEPVAPVAPASVANIPDVASVAPVAPSRPRHVRHTLFNLRRSVQAARHRWEWTLDFPSAKSHGHVAFHDGHEYVRIGLQIHAGDTSAPVGPNGYRRGLRYFGTLGAFRLWATRNRVRLAGSSNIPDVARG